LEIWKSANRRVIPLGILGGACLIAALGGCNPTKILDVTGVQSVSIAPSSVQLVVGQTQQYTATVNPDRFTDDGVTWSVAPTGMATIDSKGLLTALAPGQAVVRVTTVAKPIHTAEAAATIVAAQDR
jgi:uncharacterized protein YjdB